MATYPNGQYIWDFLMSYFTNEYGVAGLMGNLYAESGLIEWRLQGDYTPPYSASANYTADVNDGSITEYTFVHDSKGYGLAQWTISSRKQALYNFTMGSGYTIDNLDRQLEFLVNEIASNYPTVKYTLLNATSVRQASDVVLHQYENPRVQTEAVEIKRANYGIDIYNTYSGSPPIPPIPPPSPSTGTSRKPLYLYTGKRFKRKKGLIL